ncbi:hypothetical protein V6N13_023395 [Hibiscus sabdariffa]|uniref:Uncharacterized protein n=2 Tax=Hibiscus sabdariffa TaxID=183260 RepID=A0ABR1ZRJ3_9ROSI
MVTRSQKLVDRKGENMKCDQNNSPSSYCRSCTGTEASGIATKVAPYEIHRTDNHKGKALVLNEKPYFNEAGFDTRLGRVEGETNSASYNENVFILTCQSALYTLQATQAF